MDVRGLLLAAALPVAACSHAAKTVKTEAPQAPEPTAVAQERAPAVPSVKTCSGDDECSVSELCVSARCVAITSSLSACRTSAHFDFDRADVHQEDQARLQRAARCLTALPGESALVEGNCDERGTVQYNIALGFRRAHAVAKYVEDLGVPPARLSEVSYGKELPLCTESTDSCWAMNRRADVAPGAKPRDVTATIQADRRREEVASASSDGVHGNVPPANHVTRARHPGPADQPASHDSPATP